MIEIKLNEKQKVIVDRQELTYMYYPAKQYTNNTLILVHGFAADCRDWDVFVDKFYGKYNIFAINLPGNSFCHQIDDCELNPIVMAYEVANFIKNKNLCNVTLVGHSMGGGIVNMVCNILGTKYVKKAIMICPMSSAISVKLLQSPLLMPKIMNSRFKKLVNFLYFNKEMIWSKNKQNFFKLLNYRVLWSKNYFKLLSNMNVLLLIKLKKCEINNPIQSLLITAQNDRIIDSKKTMKVYRKNKLVSFYEIKNSGHIPFHEHLDETYKVIDDFLNK